MLVMGDAFTRKANTVAAPCKCVAPRCRLHRCLSAPRHGAQHLFWHLSDFSRRGSAIAYHTGRVQITQEKWDSFIVMCRCLIANFILCYFREGLWVCHNTRRALVCKPRRLDLPNDAYHNVERCLNDEPGRMINKRVVTIKLHGTESFLRS
jgi:hypothetical protein